MRPREVGRLTGLSVPLDGEGNACRCRVLRGVAVAAATATAVTFTVSAADRDAREESRRGGRGRSGQGRAVLEAFLFPEATAEDVLHERARRLHVAPDLARVADHLDRLVRDVARTQVEVAPRLVAPVDELALGQVLGTHDAIVQPIRRDPLAEVAGRKLALVAEVVV